MQPGSKATLQALLKKLGSISTLSSEEVEAIERLPATVKVLPARQDIVREGDHPTQCCLLLDGWGCRYRLLNEGKRQILSLHIPGDVPDLMSLHLGIMDHSLSTLGKATVAFIPHQSVHELVASFPAVASVLWRETLVDAATFREWMVGMGRRSAQGRVGHLFCELYLKQRAVGLAEDLRCRMAVTQSDLADALGLTNVHVNRVVQELRAKGLITLRGGELIIHDWDRLVAESEFDPAYLHLEPREA